MTPLKKWLRKKAEEFLGTRYEGPEPPERLADIVKLFAELHPNANVEDWIALTVAHGNECYRVGYVRGFEHIERDTESWHPTIPPDVIADQIDPEWRVSPPVRGIGESEDNPAVKPTEEDIRRIESEMGGTTRKVWPTKRMKK